VYRTPGLGSSWTEMSAGLTDKRVYAITATQEGRLVAGTYGWGLFKNSHIAPVAPAEGSTAVAYFRNAPNPCRGATTFEWMQPAPAHATITLIDVLGQEVARIADDQFASGRNTIAFRTGALRPGVYWARLQTGKSMRSRMLSILP
jgi:hypothetical protein